MLYPCKKHFRCAQAQHFLVFCWLLIALIRAPGKGTLKGLRPYLPSKLPYWTTVRMVRSGQWDAQAVITDHSLRPPRYVSRVSPAISRSAPHTCDRAGSRNLPSRRSTTPSKNSRRSLSESSAKA